MVLKGEIRQHLLHALLLLPRGEYTFDSGGSTHTAYEEHTILTDTKIFL